MGDNRTGDAGGPGLRIPDLSVPLRNAEAGITRAESALQRVESHLRPYDAYLARSTPSDLVHRHLLPQVVSRAFEFGAMRGQPQGERPGHPEPMRIIRDGRLISTGHHRSGEGERTGEARGERAQEARRAEAMAGRLLGTPAGGTAEGADGGPELTLFEKIFMARFEGGIPIGDKLEKGQFKFLAKSEKGWAEFFQKFVAFAMGKKGNMNDIQALVVRGILKSGGALTPQAKAMLQQAKTPTGVLVSDLKFTNGKTDKFAQLLIQNPQVMQKLASMAPGEVIGQEMLMQWAEAFGGLEFAYQALSHRVVNPEAAKTSQSPIAAGYQTPEEMKQAAMREGVRDATQGIALSARTEQAVAERLDINLRGVRSDIGLDRSAGEGMKGAASAPFGALFGKKKKGWFGAPVFVPWYQLLFRPQKFKGKPRWWVPLLYFVATSAAVFGLLYVFRYWMSR